MLVFLLALTFACSPSRHRRRAPTSGSRPAATPATPASGRGRQVLRHVPQRSAQDGGRLVREDRPRARRRAGGGLGEGRPQAAGRHDAAAGRAAAGRRRAGALRSWLEQELDRAAAAQPNPGRPMLHRLNRVEYGNAVRDLLALNVDVASLLPADDSGTASTTSPICWACRRCCSSGIWRPPDGSATLAVGDRERVADARSSTACGRTRRRTSTSKGCRSGPSAARRSSRRCPLDGEYELRVKLFRTNLGTMRGLEYPQRLEIAVDGAAGAPRALRRQRRNRGLERQPDDARAMRSTSACACVCR